MQQNSLTTTLAWKRDSILANDSKLQTPEHPHVSTEQISIYSHWEKTNEQPPNKKVRNQLYCNYTK